MTAHEVLEDPEGDVDRRYRRVLEGLTGIPATEGNIVDVLRNGDQIFPAMLEAIAQARHTVDLTTYVYWTGDIAVRFAEALAERGRAGIRVRVLLDAIGAHTMDRGLITRMERDGCDVQMFRPPAKVKIWDVHNRTHRKVLVCDEQVAFIGGVGIAREWEGDARNPDEWRDTHFRVRGPAVDGLRAAFVSNWAETEHALFSDVDRFPEQPRDGEVVVQVLQIPSQVGWSAMATAVEAMLTLAREQVRLTSAYFVPDPRMLELLRQTSERGVQVQVLVPGEHTDKRIVQVAGEDAYEALLEAGVELWRFQPTMLHAKVLTVDGALSFVGSANFDTRSLRLNEEANLMIFDRAVTAVLDGHFAEDLERAERVDPAQWRHRGVAQRAYEMVTTLFDDKL